MRKFFIKEKIVWEGCEMKDGPNGDVRLEIRDKNYHHIARVLRMKVGDRILLGDATGLTYEALIEEFTDESVFLRVIEKLKDNSEPGVHIRLFQALPKQGKMEQIIQKSTELGVSEIIPVTSARCVSRFRDEQDKAKKIGRWQKIAEEAAKQAGRGRIPQVGPALSFEEALELCPKDALKVFPWEKEKELSLKSFLQASGTDGKPKEICFFIGPEGGFTPEEAAMADQKNFQTVSLGPRILRTETAGPAVIAMLTYEFDL